MQPQLTFYQQGIILELCLLVLFFLLNYEQFNIYFFSLFRPLHFSLFRLLHLFHFLVQNNSALRNVKCDWSISFIQVGRNRTYPNFKKLDHTNIFASSLYEFAIYTVTLVESYRLYHTNRLM